MAPQPQPSPQNANLAARAAVLQTAMPMVQKIFEKSYTASDFGQPQNVPIQNVGLMTHLTIEIEGTLTQAASETLTRTELGMANVLSDVRFTDLNNQDRVATKGWHLHYLASARRQRAFGAAVTNDSPTSMGSNMEIIHGPATVTTADQWRMFYEVPCAYSPTDLRGAVYASVVNATMNLAFTLNSNFVVGSTANPTLAAYISSTAGDLGVLSAVTVRIYQHYLDQLPQAKNGPVLPLLDLATVYVLNHTTKGGLVVGDNQIAYANFRSFLSTFLLYDDFGSGAAPPTSVTDFAILAANFTPLQKYDPYMQALLSRLHVGDDFPAELARAMYYFDHRRKPINTINYGNMALNANLASVKASTSQIFYGFEALAIQNQLTQAGSLYAAA